ncbi:hypothetical protein Tco_1131042, partial [Tanacetum coccineum]
MWELQYRIEKHDERDDGDDHDRLNISEMSSIDTVF